ncbi:MAG: sugar phosphate isomerase/epimerase [Alphaproteobacteria bacterium]|nr:sugar phosphate isomerase/epimerase [Alphaproteobacteria bacterium]
MKIGMNTDSLAGLKFDEVLAHAARLALDHIEVCCGNWSTAPHIDLERMVESDSARREFKAKLADHGVSLSALNCSGNPLDPGPNGRKHDQVTRDTIRLASLLGVERVVMMSGCPGAPGDRHANWITVEWPAELREMLRWQWEEVLIPYWRDLVAYANGLGIRKLCLELHGFQNVYNVRTLNRLRDAVGETVGANFDPSHLMWMGADPLVAVRALDGAIYHVHAKDTRIDPLIGATNGVIENQPGSDWQKRSWNYVALGYGHGEQWWGSFCAALRAAGYDDVLSIEHEDQMMSPIEGVEKSVALLERTIVNRPARATRN